MKDVKRASLAHDRLSTQFDTLINEPELIRKWREGYDVVYTCRQHTADTGPLKNITSRFFYAIINRLSKVSILPGAADFRLLDRKVVEVFRTLGERALFHRGLVSWVGYRQTMIPYEAHARYGGMGGIQLIALGIQGAYLGRIYNEVKRRPRYLVRRAYGFEE